MSPTLEALLIATLILVNVFILVFLVGMFAARLFRFVSVDRVTQAPRYRIVRWLEKKRSEGSTVAFAILYAIGCFECSPLEYCLAAWVMIWLGAPVSVPLPALMIVALGFASATASRWVIRQVGWEGKTVVLGDGRQAVVGVRDFPPGVAFPPQKGTR